MFKSCSQEASLALLSTRNEGTKLKPTFAVALKAHHGLHGFFGNGLSMSSDQNPELSLKARPQRCMDHCSTLKNFLCMLVKV